MPHPDQDAPMPRDAGGIGGLALAAGVKQKDCSDPEDPGMGWVGRDLKNNKTTCSKQFLLLCLQLDRATPSPSCPWKLPWIPLFSWKCFLKHGQRVTLPDLGTKKAWLSSVLNYFPFSPFPMTDSPGDLLCHFLLFSYSKTRFLLFSVPSYTLLVWKLTLFQGKKPLHLSTFHHFSFLGSSFPVEFWFVQSGYWWL